MHNWIGTGNGLHQPTLLEPIEEETSRNEDGRHTGSVVWKAIGQGGTHTYQEWLNNVGVDMLRGGLEQMAEQKRVWINGHTMMDRSNDSWCFTTNKEVCAREEKWKRVDWKCHDYQRESICNKIECSRKTLITWSNQGRMAEQWPGICKCLCKWAHRQPQPHGLNSSGCNPRQNKSPQGTSL